MINTGGLTCTLRRGAVGFRRGMVINEIRSKRLVLRIKEHTCSNLAAMYMYNTFPSQYAGGYRIVVRDGRWKLDDFFAFTLLISFLEAVFYYV